MDEIQKRWNQILAVKCENAVVQPGFETEAGMCLRFQRQVVQAAGGKSAWPVPQGYDAQQAFEFFKGKGLVLPPSHASIPGDLFFWVGPHHGKHGHIAMRVTGNRIAENGSMHVGGNDRDARGFRSLHVLGPLSGIVRLPAPTK